MQTMILNAKPENLILYQHYHTRNRDGYRSVMVLEQGSSNDGANPSILQAGQMGCPRKINMSGSPIVTR